MPDEDDLSEIRVGTYVWVPSHIPGNRPVRGQVKEVLLRGALARVEVEIRGKSRDRMVAAEDLKFRIDSGDAGKSAGKKQRATVGKADRAFRRAAKIARGEEIPLEDQDEEEKEGDER